MPGLSRRKSGVSSSWGSRSGQSPRARSAPTSANSLASGLRKKRSCTPSSSPSPPSDFPPPTRPSAGPKRSSQKRRDHRVGGRTSAEPPTGEEAASASPRQYLDPGYREIPPPELRVAYVPKSQARLACYRVGFASRRATPEA